MPNKVLASRYNNLQNRVRAILGAPSSITSQTGYNQNLHTDPTYDVLDALSFVTKTFNAATNVTYGTDRITITSHGLVNLDEVEYDNNGNTDIYPLVTGATYYVKRISANVIELYTDDALLNKVNLRSGQTGTHHLKQFTGDKVTADQLLQLYKDVARCRIHQIGEAFTIANNAIPVAGVDKVEESYIQALEGFMTDIEADKFAVSDPGQVDLEGLVDGTGTNVSRTRITNWNGVIRHDFTVNFASANDRTGFFNAGGEIRLYQSLTGGTGDKTDDWRAILSNASTLYFTKDGVNTAGDGTISGSYTPYALPGASYNLIYRRDGASYTANSLRIYLRADNTSSLRFRVEFRDDDNPPAAAPFFDIDEDVTGTLNSNVDIYRPNGTFTLGGITYDTVSFDVTGTLLSSI